MNQESADAAHAPPGLLHQVSRGIFWNTALLPLVSVSGILLSVLVRRSFGLESGYYDVALGIANSILFYTSLGLAGSLPKFIPELQLTAGRHAAMQLIARLGTIRLAVVAAVVLVVNVWAEPLARMLDLGSNGPAYLRLLSALLSVAPRSTSRIARSIPSFSKSASTSLSLDSRYARSGSGRAGRAAGTGDDRRHRRSRSISHRDGDRRGGGRGAAPPHTPTGWRARNRLGRFTIARLEALGRYVCPGSVALLRNTCLREPGPHENPGRP